MTTDVVSSFTCEARGAAALDSYCTSSVMGKDWLDIYRKTWTRRTRSRLKVCTSLIKFLVFEILVNCILWGNIPFQQWWQGGRINVDLIKSDIPLLLSRTAMEKAKMKIDFQDRTVVACIWKNHSGHPILPIMPHSRDSLEVDPSEPVADIDQQLEPGLEVCSNGYVTALQF